jgi:hypothetical protein
MYFSFQTQARPIVFEDPELMAMRYHLLASFLLGQHGLMVGRVTYISFLTPLLPFDNRKPNSDH